MQIAINKIIIPRHYFTTPKDATMEKHRRRLRQTGKLKQIVIDKRNHLIDGYCTYLVAMENQIETLEAKVWDNREILYQRQNGRCIACGKMLQISNMYDLDTYLTIDHIIPKSMGGKDKLSNYQGMCRRCNHNKANHVYIVKL